VLENLLWGVQEVAEGVELLRKNTGNIAVHSGDERLDELDKTAGC